MQDSLSRPHSCCPLLMLPPIEGPRILHWGGYQPGLQWQFLLLLQTCKHQGEKKTFPTCKNLY